MTDLENFRTMLARIKHEAHGYEEHSGRKAARFREWAGRKAATVVQVLPGYRAQFEAAFDKDGNLLDIGSYEEL